MMIKFLAQMLRLVNNSIGATGLMGDFTNESDKTGAPDANGGNPPASTGVGETKPASTVNSIGNAIKINFPDGLEDIIKNDPSLKVFIDDEKGDINYANLIKSYVHAQKKIGADKVVIPGKNATDVEWSEYYNKLRDPDQTKYDFQAELPAGVVLDETLFKDFKAMAHKKGLTTSQAKGLFDWYNKFSSDAYNGHNATAQEEHKGLVENLKQEWGTKFKDNIVLAKRALKEFADEGMVEYFDKKGFLEDPIFTKFCNKAAAVYKEDTFAQEARGSFGYSKDEAERKYKQILGDMNGAYYNGGHPDHSNIVKEVTKLITIASGDFENA